MSSPSTHRNLSHAGVFAATALCLLTGSTARAAVVSGRIVLSENDVTAAAVQPVQDVFTPVVNGVGEVAFIGRLDNGAAYVWVDDQVVWLPTDETAIVAPLSASDLGTDAADGFVLRATIDGTLGLWTRDGALVLDEDPTDLFPAFPNATMQASLRPKMTSDGVIYFRGTVDDGGGGFADLSGLFRSVDGSSIELMVGSGDTVDGVVLAADQSAFTREYAISDEATHYIANFTAEGPSDANGLLVVDGAIVAREGDDVPGLVGEQWRQFELMSVNESGAYLFNGTMSGLNAEYVGYGGEVQLREGDVLDGRTLDFDVRFLSMNDNGNALIGWAHNEGGLVREVVLFACDGSDLASSAEILLEDEDTLDIDDDGVGDWTVADIVGASIDAHRGLGDGSAVYLEVDLDPGDLDTIVEIPVSCCGNGDVNGGEECDDGNADDTDDCPSTCLQATCGDGFVHAGEEECDDGNNVDNDACSNTCTIPLAGSSSSSSSSNGSSSSSASDSSGGDTTTGGRETDDGSGSTGSKPSLDTGSSTDEPTVTSGAEGSSGEQGSSGNTTIADGEGDTDPTAAVGGVDDDGGCGCTSGRGGWSPWMILLLAGLGRRRRRLDSVA